MTLADAIARSVKISIPVADGDFPIAAIPPKGAPAAPEHASCCVYARRTASS